MMKRMKKPIIWAGLLILSSLHISAVVQPRLMNSAEIKLALKKLQVLGSALYIAAHPDDENTSVLSWLGKEKLIRTGYLSLTRGGGGQNLIGTEKGALMSALRTYELLSARRIDGAEQFFTRAIDFGYSKTAKESIAIWNRDKVLADMVFIIRRFKPDILLSRFSPHRGGHGHHTASAILAIEAFQAAGDPNRYSDQLKYVSLWQPKRLFWNTWRPRMKDFKKEEFKELIKVDVGAFNPLLGESYSEMAAHSRSMHKSQGFGMVARRGTQPDYYTLLIGEPAKKDLFGGINTDWSRIPGTRSIRQTIGQAIHQFDPDHPDRILPLLIKTMGLLNHLPPGYWRTQKKRELRSIIRSCAGLWLEAVAPSTEVMPGQTISVKTTAINRSNFPLTLVSIDPPGSNQQIQVMQALPNNQPLVREVKVNIQSHPFSHPYWLRQKASTGSYHTNNPLLRGLAVAPYPFYIKFKIQAGQEIITLTAPVLHRWRDPVKGEKNQSLVVTPPVTLNFGERVFYFADDQPKNISLELRGGPKAVAGTLTFDLPQPWRATPASIPFKLSNPFSEKTVSLSVSPHGSQENCTIQAIMTVAGKTYHNSRTIIQYPHIPVITLHPRAQASLVRVKIGGTRGKIGYIMGSGDEIPKFLNQIGFQVRLLSDNEIQYGQLDQYHTIVTGIRAYNTRDILHHCQQRLMDYVNRGGRMLVQYNVSRRLKVSDIGPYPFTLSRNRVTEEQAPVTFLTPGHLLLNQPNNITRNDFKGWVQERGLYFAGSWDPHYTTVLASHDSGEKPLAGGLLYCKYGDGTFIYCGYSFFRQLPAGVPGALRLLVNLVATGRGR